MILFIMGAELVPKSGHQKDLLTVMNMVVEVPIILSQLTWMEMVAMNL